MHGSCVSPGIARKAPGDLSVSPGEEREEAKEESGSFLSHDVNHQSINHIRVFVTQEDGVR
ncbi:hypothetical protein E2C01_039964 [Portunus trituberculatus]|uniref:Uncharacterized protein n=1 Tax=Portunus trituberculatus TaxID=210409 RepID=A0A5B7FF62_PORTR|nr:hypothetical protein [Portunus trituberculatus]